MEISISDIADLDAQIDRLDIELASWTERVRIAQAEVDLIEAEYKRVAAAAEREAAKIREVEIAKLALIRAERDLVSAKEELDKIPAARKRLEAQKAAQQAVLDLAHHNVARCEITSPIDGVLEEVDVELGENVAIGDRVARVINLERIEVPILIAASARPFLDLGDDVRIESAGNSRQSWLATVSRISPTDDESTRSMTIYVELEQDPG